MKRTLKLLKTGHPDRNTVSCPIESLERVQTGAAIDQGAIMNQHQQGFIKPLAAVAMGSIVIASGVFVAKQVGWIHSQDATVSAGSLSSSSINAPTVSSADQNVKPETHHQREHHAEHHAEHHHEPEHLASARDAVPDSAQPQATPASWQQNAPAQQPVCRDCGVVSKIEPVQVQGPDSGIGAVAGGIAGGVLGHQVGNGQGRTVATVLGALGGMFAGNKVEQHERTKTKWVVHIRMEDGGSREFTLTEQPGFNVGQPVRVDGQQISPR